MHARILLVLLAVPAGTSPLAAQNAAAHPRGAHAYQVTGIYQGETMAPWESEISVADSTHGETKLLLVDYRSRKDPTGFLYEYRLALKPSGEFVVTQRNRGRMPGSFELTVSGGRMIGPIRIDGSTRTLDAAVAMPALPTFALGVVLASRPLAVGDTIRMGALPLASVGLERVRPFTGVVRDDSLARYLEKSPEPVWVIKGDSSYPAEFWIAKKDRLLLKAVLPQGTDGSMIEEYAGKGW